MKSKFGGLWEICAYSDSDFAGDKMIGGVLLLMCFLGGVPISCKSKVQPCVTLSNTEAEYVALNESVREFKLIVLLLEILDIEAYRPVKAFVDNIGCNFLARSITSGERSKHIDMEYPFIREQIANGLVEVQFVRSEENVADLCRKYLD